MAESSPLPIIEESRDLVFHCYAISKPRSTISWYHNNNPLNVGISGVGNNSSLTVTQVDRTHYGNYKCRASNNIPPVGEASISLVVQCKYE